MGKTRMLGLAIGLVLLVEVGLFSASFNKFFCGDSLYYFSHAVHDAAETRRIFTELDDLSTYRPLPAVLFSFVLEPAFGFRPMPYHAVALGVHLLTSLLIFLLLRRLARSNVAALVGLVFFGTQATGFYLSYDSTFLPDYTSGLLAAAAFVLFAYGRRLSSLIPFAAALFCKESAVMIPAGLATIAFLQAQDNWCQADGGTPPAGSLRRSIVAALRSIIPHAGLAVFYLIFQAYLHHGWLYPSSKSAYQFAFGPSNLSLKLKYLPWVLNLPSDWFRQRWGMLPAIVLMAPVLTWLGLRVWRVRRRESWTLLLCAAWAVAALLPAIPVAQVPMKHNLYISLMAVAVLIAKCVSRERFRPTAIWLGICFMAATAFHVRNDLKSSWVGEGSDVTEASMQAVQRAYPVLPRAAQLFILPAKVPGAISWYFDDEALFRRVYNDPSLRVYYADLKRFPPAGFEARSGVLVFAYYRGRLFDVTADYKRSWLGLQPDSLAQSLLPAPSSVTPPSLSRASIEPGLVWPADQLVNGRAASAVPMAIGDTLRESLVVLPQTVVRIPVDKPLAPDSELLVGVTRVGKQNAAALGRLSWVGNGRSQDLLRLMLNPAGDSEPWQDGALDLSRFAGQTGTLVLENTGGRDSDWIAWSRLRVEPKSAQQPAVESGSQALTDVSATFLADFPLAAVSSALDWPSADLPGGRAAGLQWMNRGAQSREALVMLPSTVVRIPVDTPLPPDSELLIGVGGVGKQQGAAQGRLAWESAAGEGLGQRQELAQVMLDPGPDSQAWWDGARDLGRFAGQRGSLVLENTGGRASDWIAWSRLRIVPKSAQKAAVEAGSRLLPEKNDMLLVGLSEARINSDIAWSAADLPGGRAAGFQWLTRGGESHEAMLVLPATSVRFAVTIPDHGRLRFALSTGPTSDCGPEPRLWFESNGHVEELLRLMLDRELDGDTWWHADLDLSRWQGQSGFLVFRNDAPRACEMAAWGSVELGPPGDQAPATHPLLAERPMSLLELLSTAGRSFDRTEVYPSYEKFDSPDGKPAFLWRDCPARPSRLSVVTLAGARLHYHFDSLPPRSYLSLGVAHGTHAGDGVEAHVYWEDSQGREEIYHRMVTPQMIDWDDAIIALPRRSASGGTLSIEASSGPKHSTIGDWLAWSRLRIISVR
jgi:hypothetical protein